MNIPGLKAIGGILLLWIALKLFNPGGHDTKNVTSKSHLWGAIWTIAVADAVMSLDNVLALAGAARGHLGLFILGLFISIPFIVLGSAFFIKLLARWPWLVWFGAGLLGWISGELMLTDPWVRNIVSEIPDSVSHFWGPLVGAGLVWLLGWLIYGPVKNGVKRV
jgi:YjbE family integral membrane protein